MESELTRSSFREEEAERKEHAGDERATTKRSSVFLTDRSARETASGDAVSYFRTLASTSLILLLLLLLHLLLLLARYAPYLLATPTRRVLRSVPSIRALLGAAGGCASRYSEITRGSQL